MQITKSKWISLRRICGALTVIVLCGLVYRATATPTAIPVIDFDNGPLVQKTEPSNVVLALSVEFPTSGKAYTEAAYVDGREYIGYFDSKSCYTYPGLGTTPRTTSTFQINSDYFTRTGPSSSAGFYCNQTGTGSGFSGNFLNFAVMSVPDILRLGLTGGDRGIDEVGRTVLDRGTIWSGGNPNFRHNTSATQTMVLTPYRLNQAIYAYNCLDQVFFSTSATRSNCNAVANTDELNPGVVATGSVGTTTVTPTAPPFEPVGTTWFDTGTVTATIPSVGPIQTVTLYVTDNSLTTTVPPLGAESTAVIRTSTYAVSVPTPTSSTAPPTAAENPAVIRGYYWTGQTTTTAPIAAAESPPVIRGYAATGGLTTVMPPAGADQSIVSYAVSGTTTTVPPAAAENPPVVRGNVWIASGALGVAYQGGGAPSTTQTVTRNDYVCHDTLPNPPGIIRRGPQTVNPVCAVGQTEVRYTNNNAANRRIWEQYTAGAAYYNNYVPQYRAQTAHYRQYAPFYRNYLRTDFYRVYEALTRYRVLQERTVWNSYTVTARAPMKPRVQVCDASEATTRMIDDGVNAPYNYCQRYGNDYKPVGQIQLKADQVRIAVMSYLIDTAFGRHGGVLRAPMKYVGPNAYNESGSAIINPQAEWDRNTGIFFAKPITDSVSTGYTYTGVINYLNRFGKEAGNYKTHDPVGELWYESLRYLQGQQTSPESLSGMTEAMKDGFPVYSTWTDPVTSACNRSNFILGIGDTNTHYDKSLPGLTSAEQSSISGNTTGEFLMPTASTIPGTTTVLDAHVWTRLVGALENNSPLVTYVDSLGRTQNAGGNPSPLTVNSTIDTQNAGSSGRSSHHWAGLAYWANTQPIRYDLKDGASMKDVRVRTFMIDVDENNQGSINTAIRRTPHYLAGKYGFFKDLDSNGKPFNGSNNVEWAGTATGTEAQGHALGSQGKRLIAGIRTFFEEGPNGSGAFSTVAISSNSFSANSPDGKSFEPSFYKGKWIGTLKARSQTLNTTTFNIVQGGVVWDAGDILTQASLTTGAVADPFVVPADRRIVTYVTGGTPKGVTFTHGDLSSDLPSTFDTVPYSTATDSLGADRVAYLRGVRTREVDGTFRAREGILGDIVNSGPTFKGGANPNITEAGYTAYFNSKKSRTGVVYVGANDGMLHAFRASDGKELFAYVPGAVLPKLPLLTSKNYQHTAFVDAVPTVNEAKVGTNWKTVLVSGMGGGAQGIFALDVSDPNNFDKDKVMFEFTDRDDVDIGNVTDSPELVKMKTGTNTYKWFIAVTSGYNNYADDGFQSSNTGDQFLFLLDVSKPIGTAWTLNSNYFKVKVPISDGTIANGLAQPGMRLGTAGEVIEMFAGDLQGNLWKFDFSEPLTAVTMASSVKKNGSNQPVPLFTAMIGTQRQPITVSPVVYPYLTGGQMVLFGTGRYLEAGDSSSTSLQSIYGVWDSGQDAISNFELARTDLQQAQINTTTFAVTNAGTSTFSVASGAKRGWYADFTQSKERLVVDAAAGVGFVAINSTIPADGCATGGDGKKYLLSPGNGASVATVVQSTTPTLYGKSNILDVDLSTASESSYSQRDSSGRRRATFRQAVQTPSLTNLTSGTPDPLQNLEIEYMASGRIYWREVKDFYKASTP